MFYSGIDLHKDNAFITTVNEDGAVVRQERVSNNREALRLYFLALQGPHRAVVECTAGWYWLDDLFTIYGIELVLAHAKYLKAISYAKVKTDKVDSATLARLLWMEAIPTAHKISRQLRDLRDVMRARLRLVQRRTTCLVSIHNLGQKLNCSDTLLIAERRVPREFSSAHALWLRLLYGQIDLLDAQIRELEDFLHPVLLPNEDIRRMLWVPGMGKITAFTVYLEIDGIERFGSDKQFVSYCRLVPGAKNSNRTRRHKSGCKDGNKYLKIAFTDMAVHAIRHYPEYRRFYAKIRRRANESIARSVVAKELARIVYHMLKNRTDYHGLKGQPISHLKQPTWSHRYSATVAAPGKPERITDAPPASPA
jgi:transposase